jgi:hypothetical protein
MAAVFEPPADRVHPFDPFVGRTAVVPKSRRAELRPGRVLALIPA